MPLPVKTDRWTLNGQDGLNSLNYEHEVAIPELGAEDVLVEIHAASLNHRELVISRAGSGPIMPNVIPSSDGAGIVRAKGPSVNDLATGDKVCVYMVPFIGDDCYPSFSDITAGVGQQINGTLCQYGVFHRSTLVLMPKNSTFEQAATLTCSALTAWNCVFGLQGRELKKGHWILTQGTGGVSIATLQFAVAIGAKVIATTGSNVKAKRLLELGATHVINYNQQKSWGPMAKALTPDGRGVDFVIDIGGEGTVGESIKAVRPDGLLVVAGLVAGSAQEQTSLMSVLWNLCIVRGVLLGTRNMFKAMNQFIEQHRLEMAVDDKIFVFGDARRAYKRLEEQQHFSKIVIKIK